MNRRHFLPLPFVALTALSSNAPARAAVLPDIDLLLEEAAGWQALKTVIVSKGGNVIAERGYRGSRVGDPTNIKSASKSVMSALVGIAIDRGLLEGVDQPIAPLLRADLPDDGDPRIEEITIGHLLSMQAGLGRTSGANYGRWVSSRNWVRSALAMPFDDEPGGRMLYSTGSTHLLSAILTKVSGRTTLEFARDCFRNLEGFAIASWDRDPQGIYLGGNQMAMSTRSLLVFGEMYRNGGRAPDGMPIVPEEWVAASWQPRTNSRFNGDGYGYGWFARSIGGRDVRYGWGYGGQMIYVMPQMELTVAMTSLENAPSARTGYRDDLHALMGGIADAVAASS